MADGADVTFPCVIYSLLKLSKYEQEKSHSSYLLKSNMTYMRMFRHEQLLHGQEDYYLQSIESAIEFILNLHQNYKEDLKLEEGEQLPGEMDQWASFTDDSPNQRKGLETIDEIDETWDKEGAWDSNEKNLEETKGQFNAQTFN